MLDISQASDFIDLISLVRASRRKGTCRYSYRQLADKLGYRSPRTLAMVHKGQRAPSQNLAHKIVRNFNLSPKEAELVFLLAEKSVLQKKHSASLELNLKIEKLKKFVHLLQTSDEPPPIENPIEPIEENVYLTPQELSAFRKRLRGFFLEIKEDHSQMREDKIIFKLKFQLYK